MIDTAAGRGRTKSTKVCMVDPRRGGAERISWIESLLSEISNPLPSQRRCSIKQVENYLRLFARTILDAGISESESRQCVGSQDIGVRGALLG